MYDKKILRARFKAYRQQLDDTAYTKYSCAIAEQVQRLPEVKAAQTIHVYWPLIARREIDTRHLITTWQTEGKQIVLPVVDFGGGGSKGTPRLRHLRFEHTDDLCVNRWGLHEPHAGTVVPPSEIDVVIVPALGAGRNGHRIGHGFGYYDAFLGALEVTTIGLIYDECLVDSVPSEPHDIPLTILVTDSEIIRPGAA